MMQTLFHFWILSCCAIASGFAAEEIRGVNSITTMISETKTNKAPLIIFGSSRSNGGTMQAVEAVVGDRKIPVVDLNKLNISY